MQKQNNTPAGAQTSKEPTKSSHPRRGGHHDQEVVMRTQEERREWRKKMSELARQIRAMSSDERAALAAKYGTVTAEGHCLSPFNTIFVEMQAGQILAQVGGFRQWKKAGRVVRKGEHAVASIWVPLKPKSNGDDTTVAEPDELKFILVPVFDVAQTEEAVCNG